MQTLFQLFVLTRAFIVEPLDPQDSKTVKGVVMGSVEYRATVSQACSQCLNDDVAACSQRYLRRDSIYTGYRKVYSIPPALARRLEFSVSCLGNVLRL